MDIALMLSGFSGLVATFVASALWATRPAAPENDAPLGNDEPHTHGDR